MAEQKVNTTQFGLGEALHDPPQAKVDIVFVHGLMGDRIKTWTSPGTPDRNSVFWPRDLLPDFYKDGRILSFGYNAAVAHFFNSGIDKPLVPPATSIDDHSIALLDGLKALRARTNTTDRPIMFVAHSLGGLVCANAIAKLYGEDTAEKAIVDNVRGMIFLGTPFAGSKKAPLALLVTQFLRLFTTTNQKKLEDLDERSEKLARISNDFLKVIWARRSGDAPINVEFYYEEHQTMRQRVPLGIIVDTASAVPRGFDGVPIPEDHIDMCKFPDKYRTGFISISNNLHQWTQSLDKSTDKSVAKQDGISVGTATVREISNNQGVVTGVIASTKENGVKVTGQNRVAVFGDSSDDMIKRAKAFLDEHGPDE